MVTPEETSLPPLKLLPREKLPESTLPMRNFRQWLKHAVNILF
jgi:hypothetical protein